MRRLLLLLLLIPILTVAQDVETIPINSEVTIAVTDAPPTTVQFELDAQQYVTITAQSDTDDVDPVIWVVDSEQRLRAYNDDSDGMSSASITNLLLSSGQYTLYVDSFNGVSVGDVILTLNTVNPNDITITEDESNILIEGFLLEDTVYRHELAVEGDTLSITARDISGDLDPYLVVYSPDGEIIAENDDHNSFDTALNTFDAHISALDITEFEMVIIEIRDFLGRSGRFQIMVD